MSIALGPFSFTRVMEAVDDVHNRVLRATAALAAAGVPYAVVGGNAVAAWVSRVDKAAVRFTQDVDILLRRETFEQARVALEGAGFVYHQIAGLDVFLDGAAGSPRNAVHVIFANEKVRAYEPVANPDVTDSEPGGEYVVLTLHALVQIKLTSYRDKDRTHLRDLIDVGLIDATWPSRFLPALGQKLQLLLDTPNG